MRSIRLLAPLALSSLLGACGGAQSAGEGDACQPLTPEMPTDRLDRAARCWGQDESADMSEPCRLMQARAGELSREGARGLALCVMRSGERSDGSWLAEAIDAAAGSPASVGGLLDAFGIAFSPATHANSFTAALTGAAQHAIGEQLATLDANTRTVLVDFAFSYALDPLREHATPWVRDLAPDSAGLAAYARERASTPGDGLDETDRWALAASGEWTGREIIECRLQRIAGCAETTEESPIALLAYAPPRMEASPGPNHLLRLFHGGEMRADEAEPAARWLSHTEYEQREMILGSLFALLFNPDTELAIRRGIALGMGGSVACDHPGFLGAVYANWSTSNRERSTRDEPWSLFVSGCAARWSPADGLQTLAAGPYLRLNADIEEALRAQTREGFASASCDDVVAAATAAYTVVADRFDSARLVWVEAARVADPACHERFAAEIRTTARDSDSHAFARLRAIEWMVEQGDSSTCGQVSGAMRYRNADYNAGPGPMADELSRALGSRCR